MIGNMRDLGGLQAADGRKIKPQMLIRSAHLAQAEEQDTEHISEVIDLRTPAERHWISVWVLYCFRCIPTAQRCWS